MRRDSSRAAWAVLLCAHFVLPACAKSSTQISSRPSGEATANTLVSPVQILKTNVSLTTSGVSANSMQLADTIGLTPLLEELPEQRARVARLGSSLSLESLAARQGLWESVQKASVIIQRTNLEIDFTLAEIEAEYQVYQEILATFTSDRDKVLARLNAASFVSNGALWAVAEALDIPTYSHPRYSVSSGVFGIIAGMVPSAFSMYTLRAVNGKKKRSESEPNMLAKLFGYPTNPEIEYPSSVWRFLHQPPADHLKEKTRLDQMIDRWIADSSIPAFTDRHSKRQLDVITASSSQRRGLSIGTLSARVVMLKQLGAEVGKMKRMLLELTLAVQGEKQVIANGGPLTPTRIGMYPVP